MRQSLEKLKKNTQKLLELNPSQKEKIILALAQALREKTHLILRANEKDLANFNKNEAFKDRLKLDEKRLEALCKGLETIAFLPDPVGRVLEGWVNYAGLKIEKVSIPLGVVGVIYEARPAISAEILALLLKSSNAGVLKGGSEARYSNEAFFSIINEVLKGFDLHECFLMLVDRAEFQSLLEFDDIIDVIVPRGSSAMIAQIAANTKIPLIKHDKGLCHIFVDEGANLKKACEIIINAKCQRVSVCNALESLLVHKNIAKELFGLLVPELERFKVKIHAHENALEFFKHSKLEFQIADEKAFASEWLDFELSVKLVDSVQEACEHINAFSSAHSEAILSNNAQNIAFFQRHINSACVYVNASTRFSDGGEFGFGAELGISTNKLHARGPMGVNELCTYKYLINGEGQIRL
ncbi:glutamate-5-semialdehyde dehydrogenase [Campylobacter sp. MIT 12-8780]|uniref:glutamate-5-semialdehyde dehydrogenase n=1 Tax=Campylobacter sp. MIT 12-8780 TaxID=2202200 RepID=UPI00115ED8DC|nr:glutamate-5-semialdehyde dehydrogenase [Campylobacter sp. MIT 12-8780]TQR41266.1 glutamate-5-semialdehyde dehydrogenase [Campylobacter sp. MIT 12-8780]